MENNTDKSPKWRGYFDEQKKVWYDPSIPMGVKALVRLLELHRSDSLGWSLSIRKISYHLGISTNTALKIANEALCLGVIESNISQQRKRRKLKLSVSLRSPVEHNKPNIKRLSQNMRQPVSPLNTDSVSPSETVNNKEKDINANTEKSQVKPNEKIEESNPYKDEVHQSFSDKNVPRETEAYKKLREKAKELGWKKKF